MSKISSRESVILHEADGFLSGLVASLSRELRDEARLQILEHTAAELGGYSFDWYYALAPNPNQFPIDTSLVETGGRRLLEILKRTPIHSALALASLATPVLSTSEKRRGGAYYTDWRLAEFLAGRLKVTKDKQPLILDPASGTGILLVAVALSLHENHNRHLNRVIGDSLCAADLSRKALRGAALALSSLCDDRAAIGSLLTHLRCGDSLRDGSTMWRDLAPNGFDVVLGNPPWEKLKVSRHEFLIANGVQRHYGSEYGVIRHEDFDREQQVLKMYVKGFQSDFSLQGSGEPDFYKLFMELALRLVHGSGSVMFYVPAGLIRSLGTKRLRQFICDKCSDVSFTVLENRSRFFPIDTRFKFVLLEVTLGQCSIRKHIVISHGTGNDHAVNVLAPIQIERTTLAKIRPDLSVPEIRTKAEWKLFRRLCLENVAIGEQTGAWVPSLMREIDMTRDRRHFLNKPRPNSVPVIEGRMIHQYRHAAKRYLGGRGRSAAWEPVTESSKCEFKPQFWYPIEKLPANVQHRVQRPRVGFCDITGQTNERTMLAAQIPAGVVCGNKVPTIVFPYSGQHQELVEFCWLGIVNSFLFDWLLRRIVTTTVNYFLLLSLPVPSLDWSSSAIKRIGELVRLLSGCSHGRKHDITNCLSPWQVAEFRAELECRVLNAYGLGLTEMRLILEDFPLLDRAQPPLPAERRSTITKDFVLWTLSKLRRDAESKEIVGCASRVERAKVLGALPFVPSHLGERQSANSCEFLDEEAPHAPDNEETSDALFPGSAAG